MAEFGRRDGRRESRVTFQTLAQQWEVDVLPTKFKHSTQKNRVWSRQHVTMLAVLMDGRLAASAGLENTISVWDTPRSREIGKNPVSQ